MSRIRFPVYAPRPTRSLNRACHVLGLVGALAAGCSAAEPATGSPPASTTAPAVFVPTGLPGSPPTGNSPAPVVPTGSPSTVGIPPATTPPTPPVVPPTPPSTHSSSDAASSETVPVSTASEESTTSSGQGVDTDLNTSDDTPSASLGATELVASWGLGWNLGNSLDVPENETAWGNPTVDPSLLEAVADAGFEVVRIPVTWSMFTGSAPDYTIDAARMARVEEVVGYVLDAGMYAIINLHHDGADEYDGVEWLTLTDENGNISETVNAQVEARFRAVWTQIADHFAGSDGRLLFESMNEIHDGYDAPDTAYYPIINRLNQAFVDIVRASGRNNTDRNLVVPGYNTNIDYTLAGFTAPEDPAPNHLILSVHFYDPWSFAGEGTTAVWGNASPGTDSWGQEDYVVGQFDKLKATYIDQGLPVIIGEYGAINQTGSESYRRYYMEYVTQAACQRGIVPVYWDNGGTGSGEDSFGLIERSSKEVVFPEILDAMFRACQSTGSLDSIAKP